MKVNRSKRGYFFTLDAILSLSVLSIGVYLLFSALLDEPVIDQTSLISSDITDYFATTKIEDLNNPYAGVGGTLWTQGLIYNEKNTILQQVGAFYSASYHDLIARMLLNITEASTYDQYGIEIWMNNELVFPQGPSIEHNISRNESDLLLSKKKIVQGYIDEESGDLFGPYLVEVFVWRQ